MTTTTTTNATTTNAVPDMRAAIARMIETITNASNASNDRR